MSDMVITLLEGNLVTEDASVLLDVGGQIFPALTRKLSIRTAEGVDDKYLAEAGETWSNLGRVYLVYPTYKYPGKIFTDLPNQIMSPVLAIKKFNKDKEEGQPGLTLVVDFGVILPAPDF